MILRINKKASLSGVFIVTILAVMVFLSLNIFLSDNIVESRRNVSTDEDFIGINASAKDLTDTQDNMNADTAKIKSDIQSITESNVLIAGLYIASGVLNVLKYMFHSLSYLETGITALTDPIELIIPGFNWFLGGIVAVLTIYMVFKVLEAISGRTNL